MQPNRQSAALLSLVCLDLTRASSRSSKAAIKTGVLLTKLCVDVARTRQCRRHVYTDSSPDKMVGCGFTYFHVRQKDRQTSDVLGSDV
jgi:hypothetical protein